VSVRLPAAFQDAIARLTDQIPPKELAARSASLTQSYRGGAGSEAAIRDDHDIAAYLTTRLPATYAAMAAVLDAVHERVAQFVPQTVLDAGAGPGTASWAASEVWPSLRAITMLDRHPRLLGTARTLAQSSDRPALATAQFVSDGLLDGAFLATPVEPDTYDLVLAGYTLAELPPERVDSAARTLWSACRGVLVIVEPGTPAGFARILACRAALLVVGARIVAPCPAPYPCPIISPGWCHFARRLPRSRAHLRAKSAEVPFEDEKFSYLAVAREGVELAPVAARIIAPPRAEKPGIRLRLCTDAHIVERAVLKRDKPAFKAISRKSWGDSF
jgi:ribosomal protein RSM22 (predicted rRNA methylase)